MTANEGQQATSGHTFEYTMTISLNVLNHLGLNLYSNVPAVLSEVVANSFDADAENVWITLDAEAGTVTILDDGHGMTREQVNSRFLKVGYSRRTEGQAVTPTHHRKVMGRKGIGKLSLFAIANTVEVHTVNDGERSALRMSVPAIRAALAKEEDSPGPEQHSEEGDGGALEGEEDQETSTHDDGKPRPAPQYHPDPLPDALADMEQGTRIVLRDLKKGIAQAGPALRVRLARRFTVIGSEDFRLFIGGAEVTAADRDYFHKLQYVWVYEDGDDADIISARCTKAEDVIAIGRTTVPIVYPVSGATAFGERHLTHDEDITAAATSQPDLPSERLASAETAARLSELGISDWIGTATTVGALTDSITRDNLNKISLIVRGKVAHEDLLEEFNENGIYSSYLIGELHVDGLDDDNEDDIATSSRQRIVEDDPRFLALTTWLRGEITRIGNQWGDLRNQQGLETALNDPLIKEWFGSLSGNTKKKAIALFGKINQLTIDDPAERSALFAQAVLGFETLRYRDNLDALDGLSPGDLKAATSLFTDITDIQAALYYQIVQQRIDVIDKLNQHLDENSLEKLLQEHLWQNLWLLDPGWERATDRKMEERIGKAFADIEMKIKDEERDARMDIRYKRTGGTNVIVELKRARVQVSEYEVMGQVQKYRDAVQRYIDATGTNESLEVVVVVGRPLKEWDTSRNKTESVASMAAKNVRVVQYEQLLADAHAGYREYLDAQFELGRIQRLFMDLATHVDARTE